MIFSFLDIDKLNNTASECIFCVIYKTLSIYHILFLN